MEFIKTPFPEHPLDTVTRLLGGRQVLAERLNVSVAAIGNWKVRGVPIEQCVGIERSVKGAVTRRDLRPDDWSEIWPELAQAPANIAQAATDSVAVGQGG